MTSKISVNTDKSKRKKIFWFLTDKKGSHVSFKADFLDIIVELKLFLLFRETKS